MQINPTCEAFKGGYEVLEDTLTTTVGQGKYIAYPTGYDNTNTVLIGAMYNISGQNWWGQQVANSSSKFDSSVTASGVQIIPRSNDVLGANVRVIIAKVR